MTWATTRGGDPSPGQPVAGLPGDVAEQDIDLEVLLERLALEERRFERLAECTDRIGEHMIEHRGRRLQAPPDRRPPPDWQSTFVRLERVMALVLTEIADGVGTLILNNPDERNTLTAPMVDEIVAAMDAFEAEESVGAIVVTGTPPLSAPAPTSATSNRRTAAASAPSTRGSCGSPGSPLPTIAAVNGAAVGAGMNLALGCDVRLAARRAKFDTRFLQIGIHPGGGHTWMFRRIAGPQATMAAVVFGEVLDGAEAERVGLAHRCVDDDALLAAAHEMAARAASAPRNWSSYQEDDPGHG